MRQHDGKITVEKSLERKRRLCFALNCIRACTVGCMWLHGVVYSAYLFHWGLIFWPSIMQSVLHNFVKRNHNPNRRTCSSYSRPSTCKQPSYASIPVCACVLAKQKDKENNTHLKNPYKSCDAYLKISAIVCLIVMLSARVGSFWE